MQADAHSHDSSDTTSDTTSKTTTGAARSRVDPKTGRLTRRGLFVGSVSALVAVGCSDGGGSGADKTSTSRTGPTQTTAAPSTLAPTTVRPAACVLTPELTAGPYHLDGHLARADITEGRPGIPFEFRVQVLALPDCAPLAGAAVDIWHCDAGGEYSGFNGNSLEATRVGGTNDQRFLRGVQLTGADGIAGFRTIFPGWYEGRTVHIHLKVLDGGTLESTYTGGHVAHVGQAFFDETLTAELLGRDPYLAHTGSRTTNEQDSIFAQAGPGAITSMTTAPSATGGYVGEFTCMVDPSATPPAAPLF